MYVVRCGALYVPHCIDLLSTLVLRVEVVCLQGEHKCAGSLFYPRARMHAFSYHLRIGCPYRAGTDQSFPPTMSPPPCHRRPCFPVRVPACSVPPWPPQIPYSSPVSVTKYPQHGVVLTLLGLVATGGYFVYQMSAGKERKLSVELMIAAIASVALGFGTLFLMLSFDLYV